MSLNNWVALFGFFALVIPAWDMWYKRKPSIAGISLIIVGIVIMTLSFIKNGEDDAYQTRMSSSVDSLQSNVDSLQSNIDSLLDLQGKERKRNEDFQQALFKEFKILRDSATNRPIKSTYNTHIERAETVNIGR